VGDILPIPLPGGGLADASELVAQTVGILEANATVLGITTAQEYQPQADGGPRAFPGALLPAVEVWCETRASEWIAAGTANLGYEVFFRIVTSDRSPATSRGTIEDVRLNFREIMGHPWYAESGTQYMLTSGRVTWIPRESWEFGPIESSQEKKYHHLQWAANSFRVKVVHEMPEAVG
jgi:hypothetical protein